MKRIGYIGNAKKVVEMKCPHCEMLQDGIAAIGLDGESNIPCKGDLCICSNCGSFNIISDGMVLIKASKEVLEQLDPEVRRIVEREAPKWKR